MGATNEMVSPRLPEGHYYRAGLLCWFGWTGQGRAGSVGVGNMSSVVMDVTFRAVLTLPAGGNEPSWHQTETPGWNVEP